VPAEWLIAAVPGRSIAIANMTTTPITGKHAGPITLFHVELPRLNVFHGGDSGYVSLDHLKADLAFVPVGGPEPSCSPESGVAMLRDLKPKVAIPMHALRRQMKEFESLAHSEAPDTQVLIPRRRVPFVVDLRSP